VKIDLRSDTVTLPTEAMRAAMAAAEVGDDVYGEDPTVNRLQEEAAAAVGKEAALFVPTGSMGNLLAVKCHTQPGDEIVIQRDAHILQFEMGGLTWFSGVTPQALQGDRGILDPDEVRSNIHSQVPYYRMRTTLVCVENSHNYGGGSVYPLRTLAAIHEAAAAAGVPVHMDGARLFNAAVSLGVPAAEIARHAESVMFCFSKGLSAPVGSVLCGSRALIDQALRVRRVVGGGMRQAGVLAAAALLALREMVDRLAEDHRRARRLASGLAELGGFLIDPADVETNILVCRLEGGPGACADLVQFLKSRQVLISQLTRETIRMVTHRHIDDEAVDRALILTREWHDRR
jgi:threonine aldolase